MPELSRSVPAGSFTDKLGTGSIGAGVEEAELPPDWTDFFEHPALNNATQLIASTQIIRISRFMHPPG
jgi:hypothetical protein